MTHSRLKILLTTPTYPPFNSGLGNAVQQQAKSLAERGCSVVVATGGARRGQRVDPWSGAVVEEFDVRGADSLLQPMSGSIQDYVQFLKDACFDVVVMNAWQTWSTDLGLRNLDAISGRKFVYSHCISTNLILGYQPLRSVLRYLAWRPYWWALTKKMCQLDGIIFLADRGAGSRFDDIKLARRQGIKIAVIPNALSPSALASLEKPIPGFSERSQLIAVGSYDKQKGHDFVLRAYACSNAKNRMPLKIYGQRFTAFTGSLRELASRLGLSAEFVSFHQGVSGDALLAEYSKSCLLLSGSHTECQPLVLLDAMATGTPFVARATGCIPSLAGGVAFETEKMAVQTINQMLVDEDAWFCMSKDGASNARSKYHPDVVGDALMALMQAGSTGCRTQSPDTRCHIRDRLA